MPEEAGGRLEGEQAIVRSWRGLLFPHCTRSTFSLQHYRRKWDMEVSKGVKTSSIMMKERQKEEVSILPADLCQVCQSLMTTYFLPEEDWHVEKEELYHLHA